MGSVVFSLTAFPYSFLELGALFVAEGVKGINVSWQKVSGLVK
jgi:hypothetical protein